MAESRIAVGETKRLLLQPLAIEDAPRIQELFPHWEIVRHLLNRVPWPYPPDGAERFLCEHALPAMERGDEWHWSLRLKSAPGELIGAISLVRGDANNRGFWLGLDYHGHGLMSEAAVWATNYWFDVLGFSVLRVSKSVSNIASRRISERQGMRLVGHELRDYVSGPAQSEIWELTAEEWNARTKSLR